MIVNKAWTDTCIARWDSSTGRSRSWRILRVLFITVNEMYVKIVGSWANNHCEHNIMIPLITERYRVAFGCWLLVPG